MRYEKVIKGIFIKRTNRFLARCIVDGETVECHVMNTGRLSSTLVLGCTVFVIENDSKHRKTRYTLIAAIKGLSLVNVDSVAPNKVFSDYLEGRGVEFLKEQSFGSSRFDFSVIHEGKRGFVEVKGVTLERDGVFMFPDAPTKRGEKHLLHLIDALKEGYFGVIAFIVMIDNSKGVFRGAWDIDPSFCSALKKAKEAGVEVVALGCEVKPDEVLITHEIEVIL